MKGGNRLPIQFSAPAALLGTLALILVATGSSAPTQITAFRLSPTAARIVAATLAAPSYSYPEAAHRPHLPRPHFSPEPDPPVPTPAPTPIPFIQRPADNSVGVFIPHGVAPPVPSVLPGHSDSITLTFDDCAAADQIQAVTAALAEVHEHAIFFVTGQCRDHFPWLVETLIAAGHQACNHTYSHPDLRRLGDVAIRNEIGRGVMAGCPYFRPPYGAWDGPRGRIARIAAEFGLTPMLWDVDSRDWAGAPADRIAAVARARGGVVLLHLHGANTAEAVRLIG